MRIRNIKHNFNRAANSYENVAIPQKIAAHKLSEELRQIRPNFKPGFIMDIGCGTGMMTTALLHLYPQAHYILNDLAEGMLVQCQSKFYSPQFSYLHGDMDQIVLPQVDLIVSNFSLQWSNHIESCLQRLYQNTKILAFNCLVEGSLKEWQDKFPQQILMHYPKVEDIKAFILRLAPKAHMFYLSIPIVAEHPRSLMQQFKAIGANTPVEKTSFSHLKKVMQCENPIHTHYQVLFAILEHRQ